jgi:hypothetical protein
MYNGFKKEEKSKIRGYNISTNKGTYEIEIPIINAIGLLFYDNQFVTYENSTNSLIMFNISEEK